MTDSAYELSPMQAGLVSNQPLARDRGTDVIQVEARLDSAIEDPVAFRRAWDETARRHDALRTAFRWRRDGSVEQWAADQVDLPWGIIAPGSRAGILGQ
jgi:IS5 family transposase